MCVLDAVNRFSLQIVKSQLWRETFASRKQSKYYSNSLREENAKSGLGSDYRWSNPSLIDHLDPLFFCNRSPASPTGTRLLHSLLLKAVNTSKMGGKNVFSVPIFFVLFRETVEAGIVVSCLLSLVDQLAPVDSKDQDAVVVQKKLRKRMRWMVSRFWSHFDSPVIFFYLSDRSIWKRWIGMGRLIDWVSYHDLYRCCFHCRFLHTIIGFVGKIRRWVWTEKFRRRGVHSTLADTLLPTCCRSIRRNLLFNRGDSHLFHVSRNAQNRQITDQVEAQVCCSFQQRRERTSDRARTSTRSKR